jgi:hypothetical protein
MISTHGFPRQMLFLPSLAQVQIGGTQPTIPPFDGAYLRAYIADGLTLYWVGPVEVANTVCDGFGLPLRSDLIAHQLPAYWGHEGRDAGTAALGD